MDGTTELLTRETVAMRLGVSADSVERLIEEGFFPPALQVTERTGYWLHADVLAFLHLRGRGAVKKKIGRESPAGGGS